MNTEAMEHRLSSLTGHIGFYCRDLTTGETFHAAPFPAFITGIIENGGLLPYLKKKVEEQP